MDNTEGKREYEKLFPGTYKCSLKIKECSVPEWARKSDGTSYKTGAMLPGFRLVFKVNNRNAYVTKEFKRSSHEKSNLYGLTRELHDSLLKELRPNEKGWFDESALTKKFLELDGRWFDVEVNVVNGYSRYVRASPCEAPNNADETVTTYSADSSPTNPNEDVVAQVFEDDDIPF